MKGRRTAFLLALVLLAGGCGFREEEAPTEQTVVSEGAGQATFLSSMEEEAVLSYEVPQSSPHILIDELGYTPESEKRAYFFGDVLPESFTVTDISDGSVIFEGPLENVRYNEEYGCSIAFGDFGEVQTEGDYRIEAELLGRSYDFAIRSGLYEPVFNEALKTYYYNRCGMTLTSELAGENAHNACHTENAVLRQDITQSLDVSGGWHQDGSGSKDTEAAARGLTNLLLSYELFPEDFSDDTGIPESGNDVPDLLDEAKYETDWLLKMQDEKTGAVYSAVTVSESVIYVEDDSVDASYAFAAALSKFSFLYQGYDRSYATSCLKAADRAWKYASRNETPLDGGISEPSQWKFPAAAEIYRASASRECQTFLNAYLANPPYDKELLEDARLYGCVTYLNTKQKVNTTYCGELIRMLMQRAEEISTASRNAPFAVPGNQEQSNNTELLHNMMIMTTVDHIITNHEYDTAIENYLHYFLGRNKLSVVYLDNVGTFSYKELHEGLGLMKQFDADSMLVFMLGRIVGQG